MREQGWAGSIDDQPWWVGVLALGAVVGVLAIFLAIYLIIAVYSEVLGGIVASVLFVAALHPIKLVVQWLFVMPAAADGDRDD